MIVALTPALGFFKPALAFSGSGAGTSPSPYIITNCAQLEEARSNLGADYKLGNDIDCTDQSASPGFTPIGGGGGSFSGSFDGNGFTISNLTINQDVNDFYSQYVGLFGRVDGGTISNLRIAARASPGTSTPAWSSDTWATPEAYIM